MLPAYNPASILREYELRRSLRPLSFATRHSIQEAVIRDTHKAIGVLGGNWSGKSELCAQIGAGILSHTYPLKGMFPNRKIRMWMISDPGVFFSTSQPRMKYYLPRGWIRRAITESSWGCDKYWEGPDGSYVRFISWDKDRRGFEGPTIDVALFDEPPPEGIRTAVLSRLRGNIKRAYYFFTPLAAASSLYDLFEGNAESSRIGLHKMPTWVNCKCLAGLGEDKLKRLGNPVELAKVKHGANCRCNGGWIPKVEIEDYLSQFLGLELGAREWGEWMFLHRRILPSFNREQHVLAISEMKRRWGGRFPDDGKLYVVLDPHGARPDFVQFWVAHPNETLYLVAELPCFYDGEFKGKLFKSIKNYYRPTVETCKQMVALMKSIDLPIGDMVIDPRAGAMSIRDAGHKEVDSFNKSLLELRWTASSFRTISVDKDNVESVDDGHRRINDYLNRINRITGEPMMMFSEMCENSIWAGLNYRRGEDSDDETKATNGKPEEIAKDPWDCTRYLLMVNPTCTITNRMRLGERADYSLLEGRRDEVRNEYDPATVYAL